MCVKTTRQIIHVNVPTKILLLIAAALILEGCDGDEPSELIADTEPPRIVGVTQIDFNHLEVTFDEDVHLTSAQTSSNYYLTAGPIIPNPPDSIFVQWASLWPDRRTLPLSTISPMPTKEYTWWVTGVPDLEGNAIGTASKKFQGSIIFDRTPPRLTSQSPSANAANVGIAQYLELRFSEPANVGTVMWTSSDRNVLAFGYGDGPTYRAFPMRPLDWR